MTISSSLNAGVAGLNANASKLASISDNIANASTYGYRRVETTFQSMVTGGNGGKYAAGGVRASTQRLISEGGTLVTSSNPTDLAIRGRGLLPVTPGAFVPGAEGSPEMLLTTTGSFRPDDAGYLRNESGMILMGWPADSDGTIPTYPRDTAEGLKPIQINANQLDGQATTEINLGLNLPATDTIAGSAGTTQELSVAYYDNLGLVQSMNVEFVPVVPESGASNSWRMILRDGASENAIVGDYILNFEDSREAGGTLASVTTSIGGEYSSDTGKISVTAARGDIDIHIGGLGDETGMTQLSDTFVPLKLSKNGSPTSAMIGVEVDASGRVNALFDTGVYRTIYQIPLVDMPNANGLTALDQQTYRPSTTSGTFFLWDAGSGPTGEIVGYAREESATDVAGELTDLIQTQRAYSTNAKVIQTVDEMLQETTNIKR
ncbi:MAG: flagellar hook-basal body complex protein [Paracoccaceae bacterium]|jgi:flagellar hook protein FlgE|nr:flagellar hook-basal body complex protein [Paracoccaceae bacterium]MDP7185074.1 flagellar hook-basal body complex protein [Paracoccaceae bacterium]